MDHMEKVRPGTGREAGLDNVRRDWVGLVPVLNNRREARLPRVPLSQVLLFLIRVICVICGEFFALLT